MAQPIFLSLYNHKHYHRSCLTDDFKLSQKLIPNVYFKNLKLSKVLTTAVSKYTLQHTYYTGSF